MYDGTLHGNWEAIVTLQQLIVLCTADGIIDVTPQAISSRTSIPIKIIEKGLKVLADPDPHSRTPGEDGRRIVLMDAHRPWGWVLVNHEKYKRLQDSDTVRAQTRERVQRHRDAKRSVTVGNAEKRHTDTDANTDTGKSRAAARGARLPADWKPDLDLIDFCKAERPDLNPDVTAARFRDYWIAQPGVRGRKIDWSATWRNWVRNEKRLNGSGAAPDYSSLVVKQ